MHKAELRPLLEWQGLRILPGLNAVTGDEGSGKTRLLRELAQGATDALWLDLRLPEHDEHTPQQVWAALQARCPRWSTELQVELSDALDLQGHVDKRLFMLSTGSRRKVALVGLLASGVTITCLDQPYAALDTVSIRILREFLREATEQPNRSWVVADYGADPQLAWDSVIFRQGRRQPVSIVDVQ